VVPASSVEAGKGCCDRTTASERRSFMRVGVARYSPMIARRQSSEHGRSVGSDRLARHKRARPLRLGDLFVHPRHNERRKMLHYNVWGINDQGMAIGPKLARYVRLRYLNISIIGKSPPGRIMLN
jgi:hypothetical protein